jgi:hypothetical protein
MIDLLSVPKGVNEMIRGQTLLASFDPYPVPLFSLVFAFYLLPLAARRDACFCDRRRVGELVSLPD